jgi:hypothetical protein
LRAAAAAKQPVTLAGTGPHETELRALAQQLEVDAIFLGIKASKRWSRSLRPHAQ